MSSSSLTSRTLNLKKPKIHTNLLNQTLILIKHQTSKSNTNFNSKCPKTNILIWKSKLFKLENNYFYSAKVILLFTRKMYPFIWIKFKGESIFANGFDGKMKSTKKSKFVKSWCSFDKNYRCPWQREIMNMRKYRNWKE